MTAPAAQSSMEGEPASGETILVIGATSAIGAAICRRLAADGAPLVLAGRNQSVLASLAQELATRFGTPVSTQEFDAVKDDEPGPFLDRCFELAGGRIGGVMICHGEDPGVEWPDSATVRRVIQVNFTSAALLLTAAAERLEDSQGAWIAAVSSVAGDRGRQSNFLYGGAKGGLSIFLQGLRNRMQPKGIHVLTVKPGLVDTPMLRGRFAASSLRPSPDRVARDIHAAIRRRRDVLYTPWFWRPVLFAVRLVPESIFKRLRL